MPDVFLSYSREDQPTARRFAEALKREGFDVWWDQALDAGEAFDRVTEKALEEASAVVVLWSKRSVQSDWVRAEAAQARANDRLVPVTIEPCKRPIMFELTHTADLSDWNGDTTAAPWRSFIAGLRRTVAKSTAPSVGVASASIPREPKSRNRFNTAVALLAGLLLIAGALLWLFSRDAEHPAPAIAQFPATTAAAAATTSTVTAADGPSLAVLPFRNMSADPDQEYFSDGLTEELLNQLAQLPQVRVIGRTSSFAFKGKDVDLREIGRVLGVNHLLEGSVRRSGNQLRITAQLIKAGDGSHVWSETYDRPMKDIFAVQEEISKTVAEALKVVIVDPNFGKAGTRNIAAYEAFLRGLPFLNGASPLRLPDAVENLAHSVALDPNYANAWLMLSQAEDAALMFQMTGRVEALSRRDHALKRVQELMPDSPQSRFARGTKQQELHNFAAAEKLYMSSIEQLPPRLGTEALFKYAQLLMGLGRPGEAAALHRRAVTSEPLSARNSAALQIALEISGALTEADAEYQRDLGLGLDSAVLRGTAVTRAQARGNVAEVRNALDKLTSDDPIGGPMNTAMAQRLDDPAAAIKELRRIFSDPATPRDTFSMSIVAQWAAYFGDSELSLQALRAMPKYTGLLHSNVMFTIWRPVYRQVRRLPEFKEFLRELGLVDHWRSTGNWGDFCKPLGATDFECK